MLKSIIQLEPFFLVFCTSIWPCKRLCLDNYYIQPKVFRPLSWFFGIMHNSLVLKMKENNYIFGWDPDLWTILAVQAVAKTATRKYEQFYQILAIYKPFDSIIDCGLPNHMLQCGRGQRKACIFPNIAPPPSLRIHSWFHSSRLGRSQTVKWRGELKFLHPNLLDTSFSVIQNTYNIFQFLHLF